MKLFLRTRMVLVLSAVMPGTSVLAEETVDMPASAPIARFEMQPRGDDFVRLDRQTGEVSLCRVSESGFACRVAADEREAYQQALAELEGRIAALERQAASGTGDGAGVTSSKRGDRVVPGEDREVGRGGGPEAETMRELDTAMNLAERAMRRFFDVIREWRSELGAQPSQD
jgi:hypothetical protein